MNLLINSFAIFAHRICVGSNNTKSMTKLSQIGALATTLTTLTENSEVITKQE